MWCRSRVDKATLSARQLLDTNPELAKSIRANDLGKYAGRVRGTSSKTKPARATEAAVAAVEAEPWVDRLVAKKHQSITHHALAVLSDED